MSDDGTNNGYVPIEQLYQMMMLQPEWSISQQAWQPPDGDFQRDQLNYTDDQLNTIMDPAFAAMIGALDPKDLAPTYKVTRPANDEGMRRLQAIIENSPQGSEEYDIAVGLFNGLTPRQALEAAGISPQQRVDDEGELIYEQVGDNQRVAAMDTSDFDRLEKWATSLWDAKLADSPEEGEWEDHEMVRWAKDAGLPDPREVYSAEYMNPELEGQRQEAGSLREMWSKAKAERDRLKELQGENGRPILGPPQPTTDIMKLDFGGYGPSGQPGVRTTIRPPHDPQSNANKVADWQINEAKSAERDAMFAMARANHQLGRNTRQATIAASQMASQYGSPLQQAMLQRLSRLG